MSGYVKLNKFPQTIDKKTGINFSLSVFLSIGVCVVSVLISKIINSIMNETAMSWAFINLIKIMNEPLFSTTVTFGITTYFQCHLEQVTKEYMPQKSYKLSTALLVLVIFYIFAFMFFMIYAMHTWVHVVFAVYSVVIWIVGIFAFAESFIKIGNSVSGND